jgi:glycosyltransferase involved in cell wall biosynthesis
MCDVPGRIPITFAGEPADRRYLRECEQPLTPLPDRIIWQHVGMVGRQGSDQPLLASHLFIFPTHCESCGHLSTEALEAGCPVIISEQAPRRRLAAASAGADLNLAARDACICATTVFATINAKEQAKACRGARAFRATMFQGDVVIAEHRSFFATANRIGAAASRSRYHES